MAGRAERPAAMWMGRCTRPGYPAFWNRAVTLGGVAAHPKLPRACQGAA